MTSLKYISILFCLAVLGGCSERIQWQNPNLPKSQWSGDRSACARYADDQAGRDLAIEEDANAATGLSSSPIGSASTGSIQNAKRYRRQLFTNCMRGRGYSKKTL